MPPADFRAVVADERLRDAAARLQLALNAEDVKVKPLLHAAPSAATRRCLMITPWLPHKWVHQLALGLTSKLAVIIWRPWVCTLPRLHG